MKNRGLYSTEGWVVYQEKNLCYHFSPVVFFMGSGRRRTRCRADRVLSVFAGCQQFGRKTFHPELYFVCPEK